MSHPLIIAIGASAGGVLALKEFFENATPDPGICYVILLHLSPNHDSQLANVLQHTTTMRVVQVTEKTAIEANIVYVIPPDKHLSLEGSYIAPSPNTLPEERRAPVDIFFRSLAETYQNRAVAVILSGTGANGSMGLKRIKEMGGAVFVQNPREAEFNEMPRSAIATALVDEVLYVAEMPQRIVRYRDTVADTRIEDEPGNRIEEDQRALRDIFTQLRLRTGHDFSNYKRATLMRRIERRMAIRGISQLPDYADFSNSNAEETQALLKDLLISVTNFFRDKAPFDAIEQDILPAIFENKGAGSEIRIWVAGCATGEEAYTLAILCAERTLGVPDAPKVQIFATDIDEAAIATAREGFYSLNDAADISAERLSRFFVRGGDGFRIRREIRETVLFAHHNFLKDPPFSRIDLISCRNVLIYLNRPAQERVMETFHFAIKPGGFLLLGTSESVDTASDLFRIHNREQHIFQSRITVNQRTIVVPETVPQLRSLPAAPQPATPQRSVTRAPYSDLHLQLVEQYAPPSLVVNADFEIVHLSPRAGRYLTMAGGEPTQALLKLIRDELRAELRNSLYQSSQKGMPVTSAVLRVRLDSTEEDLRIHVRPLAGEPADLRGFLLVVFEPAAGTERVLEIVAPVTSESATRQLEEELARLRAQLRASNEQHEFQAEELKAGNEELQAMNEELRSATEELETSKEELQSINEELSTVNQELKVKVEETTMVSNNLQNLINSTAIGTIFLDRSFRVMLFTPAVRSVFNLIAADYGRPLSDITSRLKNNRLLEDAETVIQKLQLIEREAETTDDRTLLVRLSPYRTEEDRIQGVVISFVDITDRKRAEEAIRMSEARLQRMVNIPSVGVLTFDYAGALLKVNDAFLKMLGYEREEIVIRAFTWRDFAPDGQQPASDHMLRRIVQDGRCEPYEREFPRKDGSRLSLMFVAADIGDSTVVQYAIDVSDLRRTEGALVASEEKYRTLFETIDEGFCTIEVIYDEAGQGCDYRVLEFNPAFVRQTGLADARGKWMRELAPDNEEFWYRTYGEIAMTGVPARFEHEAAAFGRYYDVYAFRLGTEAPGPVAILFNDISKRKRTERALQESEARLSVTMETAIDYAIITMDLDRRVVGWSRGAERTFEYTENEVLGESADIIFTPEDREAGAPQQEMETALEDGMAPDERWHMRKDGSRFYMSGVMRPIFNNGVVSGYVKVARDMTAQKEAEELLRISAERYRTALEGAEMAAWDWDVPNDTVIWNEQHYHILGLTPDGQEKHAAYFLGFVHDADAAHVAKALNDAVSGTGTYQAEFRIHRADTAEVRWMSGYGSAVKRGDDGRIVRMVGVMYDITRRKRVEEQKEEFIGIASHELKTPLASIKAYSEVLLDMLTESGDERSAGLMRKIEGQIDRLTNLVRALLDVTRIREGKLDLDKEPFDLPSLVRELVDDMQLTTRIGIRLAEVPPLEILADRRTIAQVISNLISNAIKYSRGTGHVDIELQAAGHEAVLSVRDYGIGMTTEISSRVFDRFFRAQAANAGTYPGLGLGLYISAEIVRLHGGRIWVESEPGKGSTFYFSLPLR